MRIQALRLAAVDPLALGAYYADILRAPVVTAVDWIEVTFGASRLIFERAEQVAGVYHFAINIPERKLGAAHTWLEGRVAWLRELGADTEFVEHVEWRADALYFADPAGNIVELIARHSLPDARAGAFSSADLLEVSEIGIATVDVEAVRNRISAGLGLPAYGEVGPTFSPLGDEHGLLIVVSAGRAWYPERRHAALPLPLRVEAEQGGRRFTIACDEHEIDLID